MAAHWHWIVFAALAILLAWQRFQIYQIGVESRKREELFQIVTENAADMIALVDVKGNRLYNSPAYKRILGYSPAELGETSAFEQIHPDDRFKILEAGREARSTGVGRKVEYRIRHKDGSWRVLESVAGTIRNEEGEVAKLVIVNRDITDRKRAEELAEHNSFHDILTGLPNRQLFLDRLQNLCNRAQRSPERQYAVLVVDLDGFKKLNESLGSGAGDQVIVEMGRRLAACLRDEDTISRAANQSSTANSILSRLGGDEFTILLEAVSDPSIAMRISQRILSAIAEPFEIGGREVCIAASAGIALSAPTHEQAQDVLQDAEVAMRRAKSLGGSRCEVFDEAMHTRAVNRLNLESELRQAMDRNQFRVYYQPIVRLADRRIVGFEALLRWQHPAQGLVSPSKFLAAAEDRGLLVAIGQWVLVQALQQQRDWDHEFAEISDVSVSVNVSAGQLADASFVESLEKSFVRTGVTPSRLHLEIAESVVAADCKAQTEVLSALSHLGVNLVLDNFGSAHSSLLDLPQLPFRTLKIDRSLINALMLERRACDSIELIALVAQQLKFKLIAEGVESVKQRDRLQLLGCELGQGYFFSKPVEAKAAEELLRQRTPASSSNVAMRAMKS